MQYRIPFGQPAIGQAEIDEVVATLRSGWLVSGPRVRQFEDDFKAYTGAEHAIAVNSCTAALQLSLLAAGIGPGDEVITTPLTFVATANAIVHTGAIPVFADVDPESQNISPQRIAERLTPKTRAIMPVHLHGRPADLDPICELASNHGLVVIADAAHAIETRYHGRHIAEYGTAAAFSFQATKNITTGEGGMVVTSDAQIAQQVRILRAHGLDKDAWRRYADPQASSGYDAVAPGFKYTMSDIAAAIGVQQLKRIDGMHAIREQHVRCYDKAFAGVAELVARAPQESADDNRHAFHLYTIMLFLERLSVDRDQFMAQLRSSGIGCGVHYRVVHQHEYYQRRFGLRRGDFPAAEFIADRTVSLPLSPAMSEQDVDEVIDTVTRLLAANRR